MRRNQNFQKVTYVFRPFDFWIFPLPFFSFSFLFATVIDLLLGVLAVKKTSKKVSSRWTILTMEQPGVVAGNSALSFSLIFLSIDFEQATLGWSLWSVPPAEVEYRWCQFWSKVMTSEVQERPNLVTAGCGQHGSQWVNSTTISNVSPKIIYKFITN